MTQGYEIADDGSFMEINVTRGGLDPSKVICVVDESSKSIFLWKGNQVGVRKRFIGARVAGKLRSEFGFHFSVKPQDQGEETSDFFTALKGPGTKRPLQAPPPTPTSSAKEAKPKLITKPTTERVVHPPPRKREEVTPTVQPKPSVDATGAFAKNGTTVIPISAPLKTEAELREILVDIQNEIIPDGFTRDLLILGNELYGMITVKTPFTPEGGEDSRYVWLKEPLDGSFMAGHYTPRVVVRDGKVLGVELLRGQPKEIQKPKKTKTKPGLDDLAMFLKEELETAVKEMEWELDSPQVEKKLVRK